VRSTGGAIHVSVMAATLTVTGPPGRPHDQCGQLGGAHWVSQPPSTFTIVPVM
jgi:hypothetical protein